MVFLELPEVGDAVEIGDSFGTIESVKAVEDLNSPVSGTVIDRNEVLIDAPEGIAEDPYGESWLLKVKIANPDEELPDVLSAAEYRAQVEGSTE